LERQRQLERRHSGDGEEPGRPVAAVSAAAAGTGRRSAAAPSGLPVRAPATAGGAAEATPASDWTADGADLAKAVIWAEVLGPPRAKRPYRR
jgi:hypothetical protein